MANITITATYTDTEENMLFYAKAKGYSEKIRNPEPKTEENADTWTELIDNPQSYVDFIQQTSNHELLNIISKPYANTLRAQKRQEEQDALTTKLEEMKAALEVNVQ